MSFYSFIALRCKSRRRNKLKAARNGELYLLCRAYFRAHGIFINLLLLLRVGPRRFFHGGIYVYLVLLRSIPATKYTTGFFKNSARRIAVVKKVVITRGKGWKRE